MRKVCVYHSKDLDGWMSAAIVKKSDYRIDLIGWNYGDPIPNLDKYGQVILVDISFPEEQMIDLFLHKKLIWIDHHQRKIDEIDRALDKCGSRTKFVNGIQRSDAAACELAWNYFFEYQPLPTIVILLGMHDSFRHKRKIALSEREEDLVDLVWSFQLAARAHISDPDEAFYYLSLHMTNSYDTSTAIQDWCISGSQIELFLNKEAKAIYENRIMSIDDNGNKIGIVNRERFNPINFGINYHEDGLDAFCSFWYENSEFHYSIYNDDGKFDCAAFAARYGGGGHHGASGFRLDHLFFLKK